MAKRVQLPDGTIGEFPDNMQDSDIESVLQKQFGSPQPKQYDQDVADRPGVPGVPNNVIKPVLAPGLSIGDTVRTVGSHLKNLVAGPYHALYDPVTPQEQIEGGGAFNLSDPVERAEFRTIYKPTLESGIQAAQDFKQGNTGAGVWDAAQAVPIFGPWAGNVVNDAQTKGLIPAAAGLATDIYAPKVAARGIGLATRTGGQALRFAASTPETQQLSATRFLVPGTPGQLLQSALKPASKYGTGVSQTLEDTLPAIAQADPNLSGVSGYAKAADAAKDAQFSKYNNVISPYRGLKGAEGPVRPGTIDGNPIADAQMNSIPAMDLIENKPTVRNSVFDIPAGEGGTMKMGAQTSTGGIVNNTAQKANAYRTNLSVPLADAIREDSNAKLNAFYSKAGGDQNAALSNPDTARIKAAGDATRSTLYPFLEKNAGMNPGSLEDIQDQYGKLADVADIANKREPVFARHDPVSLSQKIIAGHGNPLAMAWNYGVQKALRSATDSDALVNSAVDQFKNPSGTPMQPRGAISSVPFHVGDAAAKAGQGLMNVGRASLFSPGPVLRNPFFYSNVLNQRGK